MLVGLEAQKERKYRSLVVYCFDAKGCFWIFVSQHDFKPGANLIEGGVIELMIIYAPWVYYHKKFLEWDFIFLCEHKVSG